MTDPSRPDADHVGASATPRKRRMLLKDRAYEEIRARIIDGRLAPGTFVVEGGLAEMLEMSKTPVRAAIGRLEHEGFVAVSPQQGIVIRQMSLEEIVDHFDIRIALETFVVERLADRLTDEQVRALEEILVAQERFARNADVAGYVAHDAHFHLTLCRFAENMEIHRVMTQQHDKLNRVIFRVLRKEPARMDSSTREHRSILDALSAGDGPAAVERIRRHLNFGKQSLVAV